MTQDCMMREEEEIWIYHYEMAKKFINFDKLWSEIKTAAIEKLHLQLNDSWVKYLLYLFKVDVTSAFLMYKNFEREQVENEDECLSLGCFDYM